MSLDHDEFTKVNVTSEATWQLASQPAMIIFLSLQTHFLQAPSFLDTFILTSCLFLYPSFCLFLHDCLSNSVSLFLPHHLTFLYAFHTFLYPFLFSFWFSPYLTMELNNKIYQNYMPSTVLGHIYKLYSDLMITLKSVFIPILQRMK